jgi:hypothetical protein
LAKLLRRQSPVASIAVLPPAIVLNLLPATVVVIAAVPASVSSLSVSRNDRKTQTKCDCRYEKTEFFQIIHNFTLPCLKFIASAYKQTVLPDFRFWISRKQTTNRKSKI